MHKHSLPAATLLAIGYLGLLPGCIMPNYVPAAKFQAVQRELQTANEKNQLLETQAVAQQQTIRSLRSQIEQIRDVNGDPEEVLIVPVRIELASRCGGYDDDGVAGDDGIVLHIQPIDRDHHVVKSAGTLTVRLLDPLNPPGHVEYGTYDWEWERLRDKWYGRLMTNHFTVKCPWGKGHPPAHDEIFVHVVFTELITGKPLTATAKLEIAVPAE